MLIDAPFYCVSGANHMGLARTLYPIII